MNSFFRPTQKHRTIVYTVSHKLNKRAMDLGHLVIDCRASYGHPLFAMPKHLLTSMAEGGHDAEWLMDHYKEFLENSIEKRPHEWAQFLKLKTLAIADDHKTTDVYAHRFVLRHAMINYLIDKGVQVIHGGEIYPTEYLSPSTIEAMLSAPEPEDKDYVKPIH